MAGACPGSSAGASSDLASSIPPLNSLMLSPIERLNAGDKVEPLLLCRRFRLRLTSLPSRRQSFGDGPTAPVASNDPDDGRASNRRVELVKQ